MIDRYTLPEMKRIWSDESKYSKWLDIELAVVNAWYIKGVIPKHEWDIITRNSGFDIDRINEIEQEVRHDVVAFTQSVAEHINHDSSRWIHYGMTSSDVVDTAQALMLKESNDLIMEQITNLTTAIYSLAIEHKYTPIMARTHGMHAEPTTFGMKMAVWYEEMMRNSHRFLNASSDIEVGKLSGAVGTYSNTDPFIEEYVLKELGLDAPNATTQVLQRDRHANYIATLSLITSSIEKFATEIRHLQRTEVGEVEEGFGKAQKGSSAMPHKRNPIKSENLAGIARVMRGNMLTAYENMNLWHERDISNSSAERLILPQSVALTHYALTTMTSILENLVVHADRMKNNMKRTFGAMYSQRALLALVKAGLTRERAYEIIKPLAQASSDESDHLSFILRESDEVREVLSDSEIHDIFDDRSWIKHIDYVFDKCNIV